MKKLVLIIVVLVAVNLALPHQLLAENVTSNEDSKPKELNDGGSVLKNEIKDSLKEKETNSLEDEKSSTKIPDDEENDAKTDLKTSGNKSDDSSQIKQHGNENDEDFETNGNDEDVENSKKVKHESKDLEKERIPEGDNHSKSKNFNIQSNSKTLHNIKESTTSKLGRIESANAKIYKTIGDTSSSKSAGTTYTNKVFYIKKQAELNGQRYYLISTVASSTKGVIGWVKATDMWAQNHVGVDHQQKTYYLKGTGWAYTDAWGASKNVIYRDLSPYKDQLFKVNLTEKVGKYIWYRGTLNGKSVWIQASNVSTQKSTTIKTNPTSKLGRIESANAKIYKTIGDTSSSKSAGTTYTNKVFYIKKQADLNGQRYYLISTVASSTKGVIGWVKATDMWAQNHVGVDHQQKTYYLKGTGWAYTDAWGASKDVIYRDLSPYKDQLFKVNLTEKVGKYIWYRGTLNGKSVWIQASNVSTQKSTTIKTNPTSKLGRIESTSAKIYKTIGDTSSSKSAGTTYTNKVFYIKKQADLNGQRYYLISTVASSTKGVIGWVKATDMWAQNHVGVDHQQKTYYLKGTGWAYTDAWGASQDVIYRDLTPYKDKPFKINLTEKVGDYIWYRGQLNGKTVWIQASNLIKSNTRYTNIDLTFQEALAIQMTRSPQTDRYRNQSAFIQSSKVKIEQTGAIIGDGVRLRTTPRFTNNISTTVNSGTKIKILGEVIGDLHAGSTKWYKIGFGGKTLYVHSSLANPKALVASTTASVNIYETANVKSHVYATLAKDTEVNIIKKGGTWHEISYNAWRNAKRSDVEHYLNPNNNDQFQHLLLTTSVGVSAAELNKVLAGKGILDGMGQAFIKGGDAHSINEIYLISHALLETGQGTSKLANGIEVGKNKNGDPVVVTSKNRSSLKDIKTVYNMFGIQAYDHCPETCGAIHAYKQGWDTPEKAIIGGAKFIGEDYIHNKYYQNTLYKMRWNFVYPSKQYATDVGWAVKQTSKIKELYKQLTNPLLQFDIPKFK